MIAPPLRLWGRLLGLVLLSISAAPTLAAPPAYVDRLDPDVFVEPGDDFAPAILWFWHDREMTPAVIDEQLAQMRAVGFADVMLFPLRSTPLWYTEPWFAVIEHVLREAERLDMHVWLFNDNHVPSGRGAERIINGGQLGERTFAPRPDWRPMGLSVNTVATDGGGPVDVRGLWPGIGGAPAGMRLVNGRLNVFGGPVIIANQGHAWRDYRVECTVWPRAADTRQEGVGVYVQAGICFRAQDTQNTYIWMLSSYGYRGPGSYLVKTCLKDGQYVRFEPVRIDVPLAAGQPYRVCIDVQGDRIETRIDGELVDTTTDDRFTAGTIGFRQTGLEQADYGDIRVTAPDGTLLYTEDFTEADSLVFFAPRLLPETVVAVAALPTDRPGTEPLAGVVDVTEAFRQARPWAAPAGRYQVQYFTATYLDHFAGASYADLMNTSAMARFIEVIHDELVRRYPWAIGTVLRGLWDDEPHIATAEGFLPWSHDLPERLARFDAAPAEVLPAVFADYGRAGRRARGLFWRCINDGWANAFYRQQGDWAREHDLLIVSNPVSDHLPAGGCAAGGDLLKNNQWFSAPGVDAIYRQVMPGDRTLIGRWAASSAAQQGNVLVQHELFGGYGWDVTPEVLRYVVGALTLRGGNLCVLHAFWSNPEAVGYAPPFDPSNPWWPIMPQINRWVGRLSWLSRTRPVAPTALIACTRTAECYQGTPASHAQDARFREAAYALEAAQVDFDFVSDASLDGDPSMQAAAVRDGALCLGPQRYRVVVLPGGLTLGLEAVEMLRGLVASGGTLIAWAPLPTEETFGRDAALQAALGALFDTEGAHAAQRRHGCGRAVLCADLEQVTAALEEAGARAVHVQPADDELLVLRRQAGDTRLYVLMNQGATAVKAELAFAETARPRLWRPDTGTIEPVLHYRVEDDRVAVPLRLEPYEVAAVSFAPGDVVAAETPHVTACNGAPLGLTATADSWRLTVRAEEAGVLRASGRAGRRVCTGQATVVSLPAAVELKDWQGSLVDAASAPQLPGLGDWSEVAPTHSGTATYRCTFEHAGSSADERWQLDLGTVLDVAEVRLNRHALPPRWARPYRWDVTHALQAGVNTLEVTVTNTLANVHGEPLPSGLFGPVRLTAGRVVELILE